MKRNARKAYNALKKIGVPVLDPRLGWGGESAHFAISGEAGAYEHLGYYENYWGGDALNKILRDNGLYFEWENAGVAVVYDA